MTISKWWLGGGIAVAAAIGLYVHQAKAADLGGDCCADLEARLAELEATTVRKGNRKLRLVVSGEVSKALLWHDIEGFAGADKLRVIDNPNSGTKVRFAGDAKIGTSLTAGFLIELGYDETAGNLLGVGALVNDLTIRHSNVWLETVVGRVTVGRASMATDGIAEIDLANTNIASLPMSVEPLWTYSGIPGLGLGVINPVGFDGGRANIVRYDSPNFAGFQASAAWGGGQTFTGDDQWDAALRWAGEFSGFRVAVGAGYRVESFETVGADDMRTLTGSASVLHVTSGLFVNGYAGHQDSHPIWGDVRMWQARGGWSKDVTGLGATALFLEYGDHQLKDVDVDSTFVGGGITQALDAAAMDLFLSYRSYDIGGTFDAAQGMAGARIRF